MKQSDLKKKKKNPLAGGVFCVFLSGFFWVGFFGGFFNANPADPRTPRNGSQILENYMDPYDPDPQHWT
jgi:hypothetical protein